MDEEILNAHQAAVQLNEAARKVEEAKEYLMDFAKRQRDITKKVLAARGLLDTHKYRHYTRSGWLELEPQGYLNNGKYGTYPVIHVEMWERGYCGNPDSVEGGFNLDELILLNKDQEFEQKLMDEYESASQKEARSRAEAKLKQIKALEAQLEQLKG